MTQNVFLKMHHSIGNFRGGSDLTTWIYRISVNCCIDSLRARKAHVDVDAPEVEGMVALNLSGHENSSLARVDLARILAQTDAQTREIVFMALAEGCGYDEIGEVVGMTGWAVSKIVNRFRKRILTQKKAWFAELFNRTGKTAAQEAA